MSPQQFKCASTYSDTQQLHIWDNLKCKPTWEKTYGVMGSFVRVLDTRWTFKLISYASCRFGNATDIFSVCFPRKPDGKTFSVQIGAENVFPYVFRGNGAEKVERFRQFWRGKCFFPSILTRKNIVPYFSAETRREIVVFSAIIPHTIKNAQKRLKSTKMQMSMP